MPHCQYKFVIFIRSGSDHVVITRPQNGTCANWCCENESISGCSSPSVPSASSASVEATGIFFSVGATTTAASAGAEADEEAGAEADTAAGADTAEVAAEEVDSDTGAGAGTAAG